MRNMIDLVPYLPETAARADSDRKEQRYQKVTAAVESVVTLGIGAGFFIALTAFLSAII
ncbi:MAG: hypothetical protein IJJ99_09275 [Oscillospiraceae bacterium]|nr:hypothetical protein [Oscillospiraceae bacterium]